ncbi:MAG: hypothetical protein IJB90_01890 [Clostridia bacterium]|nr:hypothetical protein [Clostridia bacterium]
MKKEKKNKKTLVKKIIIFILLIILLGIVATLGLIIYSRTTNVKEKNTITATKTIEETQTIKYIIKIKDYNIQSAIKEITFKTEQEAKSEYNKYEIINEYERREIGLELKKKKLILVMPEKQVLKDIGYNTEIIKTITFENGEKIEIIDQSEIKQCLVNQGYEIK